MMKNMSPEQMAAMSRQAGVPLSTPDIADAQRQMAAMQPDQVEAMAKLAAMGPQARESPAAMAQAAEVSDQSALWVGVHSSAFDGGLSVSSAIAGCAGCLLACAAPDG